MWEFIVKIPEQSNYSFAMKRELMISCFFLLLVLYGVLGDDNCLYSLPSCTDSTIEQDDLLEFGKFDFQCTINYVTCGLYIYILVLF